MQLDVAGARFELPMKFGDWKACAEQKPGMLQVAVLYLEALRCQTIPCAGPVSMPF